MQRRIMFALPFVFVIFIINFEAGLIVYWITTNVWTIGQQLLVKKLYPKPVLDAEAQADRVASTPARGKPPSTVMAASDGGDGKAESKEPKSKEPKSKEGKADRKAAAAPAGGGARTKAPPASPRKKKKRSGRRR
jgi:YidC/Oxa1 family membrane protein insertase